MFSTDFEFSNQIKILNFSNLWLRSYALYKSGQSTQRDEASQSGLKATNNYCTAIEGFGIEGAHEINKEGGGCNVPSSLEHGRVH